MRKPPMADDLQTIGLIHALADELAASGRPDDAHGVLQALKLLQDSGLLQTKRGRPPRTFWPSKGTSQVIRETRQKLEHQEAAGP